MWRCILLVIPLIAMRPAAATDCLTAVAVVEGDEITLGGAPENAGTVRLAAILAPLPPLTAPPTTPWPPADAARRALTTLIEGRCLRLAPEAPKLDRYHRRLALVYRSEDGLSLQEALVRGGMARVSPETSVGAALPDLLAIEAEARMAGRGLWADPAYQILAAGDAGRGIGDFRLVEGRIAAVNRVGSKLYLNFGTDWRTDFTIVIPTRSLPAFAAAGIDPLALAGKRVRVRGMIEDLNGPMIEVIRPEALEPLAAAAGTDDAGPEAAIRPE